jgi:hypothetical protein
VAFATTEPLQNRAASAADVPILKFSPQLDGRGNPEIPFQLFLLA